MEKFSYSDGISARGRRPELIVYTRNDVYIGTNAVPGVCSILEVDYHKNGKWSNTTFDVFLSEGAKGVIVRQDFETGKFFPDTCLSWSAVAKELGLEGVNPKAVERAVRKNWPNHARRFDQRRAELAELEQASKTNTLEFVRAFNTNRIGNDVLLIDGNLFRGETIPGKVVVLSAADNGQGGALFSHPVFIRGGRGG